MFTTFHFAAGVVLHGGLLAIALRALACQEDPLKDQLESVDNAMRSGHQSFVEQVLSVFEDVTEDEGGDV